MPGEMTIRVLVISGGKRYGAPALLQPQGEGKTVHTCASLLATFASGVEVASDDQGAMLPTQIVFGPNVFNVVSFDKPVATCTRRGG